MKLRQKIYDSSEKTNKLIKITNSYHLYKNLESIRNRKPIYINNYNYPFKKANRQKSHNDLSDYYKNQETLVFNKILEGINSKKVERPLNNEQNLLIKNSRESRLLHKSIEDKTLEKENEKYKKRIYGQKAVISAKDLDEEYKRRLFLGKIKNNNNKNNKSNELKLPPINKY